MEFWGFLEDPVRSRLATRSLLPGCATGAGSCRPKSSRPTRGPVQPVSTPKLHPKGPEPEPVRLRLTAHSQQLPARQGSGSPAGRARLWAVPQRRRRRDRSTRAASPPRLTATLCCLEFSVSHSESTAGSDCLVEGSSSTTSPRWSGLPSGRGTCGKQKGWLLREPGAGAPGLPRVEPPCPLPPCPPRSPTRAVGQGQRSPHPRTRLHPLRAAEPPGLSETLPVPGLGEARHSRAPPGCRAWPPACLAATGSSARPTEEPATALPSGRHQCPPRQE